MEALTVLFNFFVFAHQLTRLEAELAELTSKNEKVEAEYEEVGKTEFLFYSAGLLHINICFFLRILV